jgi:hypothetical protein
MRKGTVGENHNRATAAQVNEYPSCRPFPQKLSDMSFAGNGQMCKQWCHDHKTCTSDNWKRTHDMGRWVVLHAVPYSHLENTRENLQSCSVLVWTKISWYSILLVPLLPFMAELLQGSTWTGWVIRCILWSRHFWTTMPPFTHLELFQFEEHLPWPAQSIVLKTSVRNRFPPPTSLKQLEDVPSRRMV